MAPAQTLVVWSDNFSLGLAEVDEQHRYLFQLINEVWGAVINKADGAETLRLIEELEKYTVTHFTAEETFMRTTGYSQFDAHKATHAKFIARIAQEKSSVLAGKHLSLEILHFLRNWLIDHILVYDKAYADEHRQRSGQATGLGKFFKRFAG